MSTWSGRAAKGSKIQSGHSAYAQGYRKCPGGCGEWSRCRCSEKSAKERYKEEVAELDADMRRNLPTRSQLRRGR